MGKNAGELGTAQLCTKTEQNNELSDQALELAWDETGQEWLYPSYVEADAARSSSLVIDLANFDFDSFYPGIVTRLVIPQDPGQDATEALIGLFEQNYWWQDPGDMPLGINHEFATALSRIAVLSEDCTRFDRSNTSTQRLLFDLQLATSISSLHRVNKDAAGYMKERIKCGVIKRDLKRALGDANLQLEAGISLNPLARESFYSLIAELLSAGKEGLEISEWLEVQRLQIYLPKGYSPRKQVAGPEVITLAAQPGHGHDTFSYVSVEQPAPDSDDVIHKGSGLDDTSFDVWEYHSLAKATANDAYIAQRQGDIGRAVNLWMEAAENWVNGGYPGRAVHALLWGAQCAPEGEIKQMFLGYARTLAPDNELILPAQPAVPFRAWLDVRSFEHALPIRRVR